MADNSFLTAKSIHIFGCAFQFAEKKRKGKSRKVEKYVPSFREKLKEWGWKQKCFDVMDENGIINKEAFMLKQYLSNPAENIYFEKESKKAICTVYEYPFDGKKFIYHIQKNIKNGDVEEQKCFDLPIDAIELHIYNCGVGILFYKVLNMEYSDVASMKLINDYGRRIKVAYIPEIGGTTIWADEIGIKIMEDGKEIASSIMNYSEIINKIQSGDVAGNIQKLERPAEFINRTLYVELATQKTDKKDTSYDIDMYYDDRMFLVAMLRNDDLSKDIKGLSEESKIFSEKGLSDLEEKIYSIVFADQDDATCQDTSMRRDILQKSLYRRWLNEKKTWGGSLYGITSYSYVAMTSESDSINPSVVLPFYSEYLYLVSLVLAQRIGIAKFCEETAENANAMNDGWWGRLCKTGAHVKLQERYIVFNNQIMVLEPTCQEQGIDIYKMLQVQLLVKEEQEILEAQLQSLYEAISVWRGNFWSNVGPWLTAIVCGSLFALINAVKPLLSQHEMISKLVKGIELILEALNK